MEHIDFRGYSGDCLIHGHLLMPTEMRLTDYLNASRVLSVRETSLYALVDGRPVVVGEQEVPLSDLWAVEPTDSGITPWHADLRVATRATRIDVDMPPYSIRGTLHAISSHEALPTINRRRQRRQMIPLTDAEVTFVYMGQEIIRESPVVIINRERVVRVTRGVSTRPGQSLRSDGLQSAGTPIATL